VLDRIGVRTPHDIVEKGIDAGDEEVAHADLEAVEVVVLAPFLV
jgi:hypothetical protein